jgi:hypothetical protein
VKSSRLPILLTPHSEYRTPITALRDDCSNPCRRPQADRHHAEQPQLETI